jgi:nitrite reductase/ring-hydroxylating ferredoxin subunit
VTLTAATGATVEVIVVNAGQRLSAYRNECAHEALPLNNAVLDLGSNTLTARGTASATTRRRGAPERARRPAGAAAVAVDDGTLWIRVTA